MGWKNQAKIKQKIEGKYIKDEFKDIEKLFGKYSVNWRILLNSLK